MKRRNFVGGLVAAPAIVTAPSLLVAQPGIDPRSVRFAANTGVLQRRVIGAHMNSTWWHSEFGSVPRWMHRMCLVDGGKSIASRGQFDDFSTQFKNPPKFDQTYPEVRAPSGNVIPYTTWAQHNRDNYTDIVYVTDNFQGPPNGGGNSSDPNVGGPIPAPNADDYVTEFTETLTIREANTDDAQTHWLYENWCTGEVDMNPDGTASAAKFATWRDRTTAGDTVGLPGPNEGWSAWFDNLRDAAKANLPEAAPRIRLIPAARGLVSVMENTAASAMECGDWFEDDAPHGRHTLYLVVAAICYSTLFEEVAPQPIFRGALIHPAVADNWSSIASHIFSHLGSEGFIQAS